MALFFSGCQDGTAVMKAYLMDVSVSQAAVHGVMSEFGKALDQLSQQRTAVQIDAEVWDQKWTRWLARLSAETRRIEDSSPPSGAGPLKIAVLRQYKALARAVEATRPMVEIADQLSRADRRAEEDPGAAPEITKDMAPVEKRRQEVARRVDELLQEVGQAEEAVRNEQRKIADKYGISLQMEKPATTGPARDR